MHTLSDLYTHVETGQWSGAISLSSESKVTTYNELAHELKACLKCMEVKVNHNDIVILKIDSNIQTIAALLCLWRIGAVVVPIKSNIEPEKISSIALDCNAKFLVELSSCDKAEGNSIKKLSVNPLNTFVPQLSKFIINKPQSVCGSDRALIIYTSGTTGTPKGIILSHNNVVSALRAISDYLDISPQERILNISPLSFDYGLYQLLFSIYKDCSVVLFDENVNPITLVKAIERHEITLIPALPVIATLLEKGATLCKKALPSLRKITNTGGHLSESTIDALQLCFPKVQIYAMYGLTESKRALYLPPEDLKRKRGSVGIPMPGLEAKVFIESKSASGEQVFIEAESGQIGSLFVRGPSVMQGYTREDSGAGARVLNGQYRDDNWLDTGDLFTQDEEGYFFFKGRAKELIKQAGYCLYAKDIEEMVLTNKTIQFASVVGTLDRFGAEVACLFIKLHDEQTTDHEPILNWIKQTLGTDYCPRILKVVEDVKLSINGKIDKKQMLQTYA